MKPCAALAPDATPSRARTTKSTDGRSSAARREPRTLERGETVNATGPGSCRAFPTGRRLACLAPAGSTRARERSAEKPVMKIGAALATDLCIPAAP